MGNAVEEVDELRKAVAVGKKSSSKGSKKGPKKKGGSTSKALGAKKGPKKK